MLELDLCIVIKGVELLGSFLSYADLLCSFWYFTVVVAMCAGTLLMSKLLLLVESPTESGMTT